MRPEAKKPLAQGDYGNGTTGRVHQISRAAAHRLSPNARLSRCSRNGKGQEIEKEKKDAATVATTVAATNRPEGGRSSPRGRVRRADQLRTAPPSQTTQPQLQPQRDSTPGFPPLLQQRRPAGRPQPAPIISDLSQEVASLKEAMILYWNPGGIIGKTRELRDLAQLGDAHIILLGETKLRPEQELRIPNFFAYRRDEISARGPAYRGTAVLIRRDLMHKAEQLTDFETMRSIGIRVGSSEQEIRLFAAYRPPGTRMTGRLLVENAERHGYEVLGTDTPTYMPTDMRHRPDVLDIVIGHKIRRPMHVEVVYGMDTQHLPILVTVGNGTSNSPQAALRQRVD
ncbi:hypothetical protein EVAR_13264_1 [Eumeta japonica]|uniref:Uncharacterized protein n=1 Tax=Eumeta variegata TaxID=151549 RepID=A0A4C1YLD8_EUMVA|nr:hypothetical protein EVAR_13264_1 [Eumeta japonica]